MPARTRPALDKAISELSVNDSITCTSSNVKTHHKSTYYPNSESDDDNDDILISKTCKGTTNKF